MKQYDEQIDCDHCGEPNTFLVADFDAHYDDECNHIDCYSDDDVDREVSREIARVQRRYDRYVQQVHQLLHVDQSKQSSLFADNCSQEPCMSLFQDLGSTLV